MLFSFFVTGCSSDAGGQSSAAPETQAVSTEGQTTEEATETQPATEPLTQATEAPSTEEVTETQPPAEPDVPLIGDPYLRKDLEALWDFDYVAFVRKNPELVNSARHPWIEQLKKDEAFLSAAEARWPDLKAFSEELTKEGGVMDTWVREIQTAQIYDEEENGRGEWGLDSYEEDVETLRSWIITRTEKIDAHMSTDFRERTVDPPSYDD